MKKEQNMTVEELTIYGYKLQQISIDGKFHKSLIFNLIDNKQWKEKATFSDRVEGLKYFYEKVFNASQY